MHSSLRRPAPAWQQLSRRAFLAAAVATLAACSDKGDGPTGNAPRDLAGSYNISSVAGNPASSVGVTGTFVIQPGNRWTMSVRDDDGQVTDNGTYAGDAAALNFSSAKFSDAFNGSAEDNNSRLTVRYDFGGRTGVATLVFTR